MTTVEIKNVKFVFTMIILAIIWERCNATSLLFECLDDDNFPKIYGGSYGDTSFDAIALGSSGQLYIGGMTEDMGGLVQTTSTTIKSVPLLIKVDGTSHQYVYQKWIDGTSGQTIGSIATSDIYTFVVLQGKYSGILTISSDDNANLIQFGRFSDTEDENYIKNQGLALYVSAPNTYDLYLAFNSDQNWDVRGLSFNSDTLKFNLRWQTYTSQNLQSKATAMTADFGKNNLYVGGRIVNNGNIYASLTALDTQDGSVKQDYSIYQTTTSTSTDTMAQYFISQFVQISASQANYFSGTYEQSYSVTANHFIIFKGKINRDTNEIMVVVFYEVWYDDNDQLSCIALSQSQYADVQCVLLYSALSGNVYLVHIWKSQISVAQIYYSNLFGTKFSINAGVFDSTNLHPYYVGSILKFNNNDFSKSLQYQFKRGYVIGLPLTSEIKTNNNVNTFIVIQNTLMQFDNGVAFPRTIELNQPSLENLLSIQLNDMDSDYLLDANKLSLSSLSDISSFSVINTPSISSKIYYSGNPTLKINIDKFITQCSGRLSSTTSVSYTCINSAGNDPVLPDFIKFDSVDQDPTLPMTISVQSDTALDSTYYINVIAQQLNPFLFITTKFTLNIKNPCINIVSIYNGISDQVYTIGPSKCGYGANQGAQVSFTMTVNFNQTLYDSSQPIQLLVGLKNQYVKVGNSGIYILPPLANHGNHTVKLSVALSSQIENFMQFDGSQLFTINPTDNDQAGTYTVVVQFIDYTYSSFSFSKSFKIIVQRLETASPTNIGVVQTSDTNSQSNTNTDQYQNQSILSSQSQQSALKASIISVSTIGIMTLVFSERIIVPLNYAKFNSSVIDLDYQQKYQSSDNKLEQWWIVTFSPTQLEIQLVFTNPLKVSEIQVIINTKLSYTNSQEIYVFKCIQKDLIEVKFIRNDLFITQASRIPIQYLFKVSTQLPPQIKNTCTQQNLVINFNLKNIIETLQTLTKTIGIASTSMGTVFIINLLIGIILMWSLINLLQLIIHIPLLQINLPSNVIYFLDILGKLINLKILPTDKIIAKLKIFKSSVANSTINTNYQNSAQNMLQSIGAFLLIVLLLLAIISIIVCIGYVIKKAKSTSLQVQHLNDGTIQYQSYIKIKFKLFLYRPYKIYTKIKSVVMYNTLLRTLLQSYFVFALSDFNTLPTISFQDQDNIISGLICIMMLLFIIAYPFILFKLLTKNSSILKSEKFKAKYQSVYLNIKTKERYEYLFCVVFIVRRLILAFALRFITMNGPIQLLIQTTTSLMMALYVLKAQPFDTKLLNVIEILNETTYLVCCYFCFLFADFVNNVDLKQKLGWVFLGFIAICISINVSSLVISNIITIIKAIKNRMIKQMSKIQTKIEPKQQKIKFSRQINNSFTGLKNQDESSFQYEQDHNHNQQTHLDSFAHISQNEMVNADFLDDIVNRDDPYSFDSYQSPNKKISNQSLFNIKIQKGFEKHSSIFNKPIADSYLFKQSQQTTQYLNSQSKPSVGLKLFEPQETNIMKQETIKKIGPIQSFFRNIISDQQYTVDKSQNNINPYNQTSDMLQNDQTIDHQVFKRPQSDQRYNEFQDRLQKLQQYINL